MPLGDHLSVNRAEKIVKLTKSSGAAVFYQPKFKTPDYLYFDAFFGTFLAFNLPFVMRVKL